MSDTTLSDYYLTAIALVRNRLGTPGDVENQEFSLLLDQFNGGVDDLASILLVMASFAAAMLEGVVTPDGAEDDWDPTEAEAAAAAASYLDSFLKHTLDVVGSMTGEG